MAAWLTAGPGGAGATLEILVQPRASRTRAVGEHDGRLKVQLAAPPVEGEANAALVEFLAGALGVRKAEVVIVRGETGRRKTVRVAGASAAAIEAALGTAWGRGRPGPSSGTVTSAGRRWKMAGRHRGGPVTTTAPRSESERIQAFLAAGAFAVVGASTDRAKYGNKVLRCYQQHGRTVFPINPKAPEVEGLKAYPSLGALPARVPAISVITPPAATEQVVREAHAAGVQHVWMQPGAESQEAIRAAEALGMNVIAGGPCLLVVMGYREGHG